MRKSSAFAGAFSVGHSPSRFARGNAPVGDLVVSGGRPTRLPSARPMPSATHTRNAWLVRLCTLTAFVLSLSWVSLAQAAAPMCGMRAETIAAPPIGTPASSDSVSAGSPCNDRSPLRLANAPQRDAPEKLSIPELPIRALPILPRLAACPIVGRVSPALPEHELLATGFARSIDRPPRV
jgi:hypothetical protein